MQITTETITPEIAAEYLKHNTNNRNIRTSHVEYLSNAIKRGEWVLSHQGIAFDESGILVDGQHRLHAIIKSGIPVQVLVSRNVSDNVFKVTDKQVTRTYGDILHINTREVAVLKLISDIRFGAKNHSADQLMLILNTELGRRAVYFAKNHIGVQIVTRSGYILALAVRTMIDQTDYPQKLHNDLRLGDSENLPPIGYAFIKMMLSGSLSASGSYTTRCEDLARGLVLFDKAKSQNKLVKAMDVEVAKNMVVQYLGI